MTEHFPSNKYDGGDKAALMARNARARELRREGFVVVCSKWDFTAGRVCLRDYILEYDPKEGVK